MLDSRICIAGWMAALVLAAVVNSMREEPSPCTTYNEMRAIWDESGHEYGWPEYEPGKDEECGYES